MPYEASSTQNYEEYKKMALTSYVSMQKGSLAVIFLTELLFIAFAVLGLAFGIGRRGSAMMMLIVAVAVPVVLWITINMKLKKVYNSTKMVQDLTCHYRFFEDHGESSTVNGITTFAYKDLYRVIETKTNFYLFIGQNQAFNVVKADCSNELIAFLQQIKEQVNGAQR